MFVRYLTSRWGVPQCRCEESPPRTFGTARRSKAVFGASRTPSIKETQRRSGPNQHIRSLNRPSFRTAEGDSRSALILDFRR